MQPFLAGTSAAPLLEERAGRGRRADGRTGPAEVGGRAKGAELTEWTPRRWVGLVVEGGDDGVRVLVKTIVTANCSPAKYDACDGVTCTQIAASSSSMAATSSADIVVVVVVVAGKAKLHTHTAEARSSSASTTTTAMDSAGKLEPFLLMAKMAKGPAAAKLVHDATAANGVFVFAELLEMPNIQEVRPSSSPRSPLMWSSQLAADVQHAPFFALLQLFSYRTYTDYLGRPSSSPRPATHTVRTDNRDSLPPLDDAQITKLKYLTIVSLASEHRVCRLSSMSSESLTTYRPQILPYSLLLDKLQMPNIRELEDLIIDAIYLDVLRGKLDQKEQQLEIEYTMGRDLEPGRLDKVLAALENWYVPPTPFLPWHLVDRQRKRANTTASVLEALDRKHAEVTAHRNARETATAAHDDLLAANLKTARDALKKATEKTTLGLGDMDIESMRNKREISQSCPIDAFLPPHLLIIVHRKGTESKRESSQITHHATSPDHRTVDDEISIDRPLGGWLSSHCITTPFVPRNTPAIVYHRPLSQG